MVVKQSVSVPTSRSCSPWERGVLPLAMLGKVSVIVLALMIAPNSLTAVGLPLGVAAAQAQSASDEEIIISTEEVDDPEVADATDVDDGAVDDHDDGAVGDHDDGAVGDHDDGDAGDQDAGDSGDNDGGESGDHDGGDGDHGGDGND